MCGLRFYSQILYDPNNSYKNELEKINQFTKYDLQKNLNTAIRAGLRALFYLNGFYSPAEDRALYYSFSLQNLPYNYEELILQIYNQKSDSEDDYFRREKLFMEGIVDFIENTANKNE